MIAVGSYTFTARLLQVFEATRVYIPFIVAIYFHISPFVREVYIHCIPSRYVQIV
jgi:hypothetical protein